MLNLARAAAFLAVVAVLAAGAPAQSSTLLGYRYDTRPWRSLFTEDFNGVGNPAPSANWASSGYDQSGTGYLDVNNGETSILSTSMTSLFSGADEWVYEMHVKVNDGTEPLHRTWQGYRYSQLMWADEANLLMEGGMTGNFNLSYRQGSSGGAGGGTALIYALPTSFQRDIWYTIAMHRRDDEKVDFYVNGVKENTIVAQVLKSTALPNVLRTGAVSSTVSPNMDINYVYVGKPALPGDANLDGTVDISDFFILKTYFDEDPSVWQEGNFNEDTIVDLSDFFILKAHFDESNPEPATIGLLALGGCLALVRRRRR